MVQTSYGGAKSQALSGFGGGQTQTSHGSFSTPQGEGQSALQGPVAFSGTPGTYHDTSAAAARGSNKFREDLGFRMNKQNYKTLQESLAKFNAEITALDKKAKKVAAANQAKFDKGKAEFDSNVRKEYAKLNKAKQEYQGDLSMERFIELGAFKGKRRVPVRVVSGNNIEGTYHIPKDFVDALEKDKGNLTAGWVDGGKNYNVEVRQGGRIQGAEMHKMVRDMSSPANVMRAVREFDPEEYKKIEQSHRDARKGWAEAKRSIAEAEGTLGSQVASANQELEASRKAIRDAKVADQTYIAKQKQEVKQSLATPKKNYAKRRRARSAAYSMLGGMGWNK